MDKGKEFSKDLMIMNPEDNVAVCLREIKAGEELITKYKNNQIRLKIIDPIPLGHKVSLTEIEKGSPIVKYGEIIGKSKGNISVGQHVHVHNIYDS